MYGEETVKIEFGRCCIEIQCHDQEFMAKMRDNYRPFLISREPDFRISFNLRKTLTASEVKNLLTSSRSRVDEGYFESEILKCRVDWAEATLRVDMEREILAPSVEYKLMNSLLRGIYAGIYARIRNTQPDAYLVHGCGIVDGNKCYLFTGPSGSGKTTLAKLAGGRKVLNDEAVLIGRDKKGFYLTGTPFDGGIPDKCNDSARLSAIIFLKHDTQVSLRELSKTETYYRLLAQIFDTTPLLEATGADSLQERANLSAKVATEVSSYELSFLPDGSFWQVIESI